MRAAALVMPLFVLAELRFGVARATRLSQLEELVHASRILAPDAGTIPYYVEARDQMLRGRTLPADPEKREGLHHDIWIAALCRQHQLPLLTRDSDYKNVSGLQIVSW